MGQTARPVYMEKMRVYEGDKVYLLSFGGDLSGKYLIFEIEKVWYLTVRVAVLIIVLTLISLGRSLKIIVPAFARFVKMTSVSTPVCVCGVGGLISTLTIHSVGCHVIDSRSIGKDTSHQPVTYNGW